MGRKEPENVLAFRGGGSRGGSGQCPIRWVLGSSAEG